eukprot:5940963-Pleurochrysis_carterae.AAC.6
MTRCLGRVGHFAWLRVEEVHACCTRGPRGWRARAWLARACASACACAAAPRARALASSRPVSGARLASVRHRGGDGAAARRLDLSPAHRVNSWWRCGRAAHGAERRDRRGGAPQGARRPPARRVAL